MSARARRSLGSVLAVAAIVIVGGVVKADAPTGQYFAFERDTSCISDTFTKLTWMRKPLPGTSSAPATYTWHAAAQACANLDLAVPTPWRLPSLNELETLVDDQPHPEGGNYIAIDVNAFPGTPGSSFWTSSIAQESPTRGWTVEFGLGTTNPEAIVNPYYVRCVNDWTPGSANEPPYCQAPLSP